MKRIALPTLFLALLLGAVAFRSPQDHPSEVSRVLATYAPPARDPGSAAAMAVAARAFLASLDDDLRAKCALTLDSPERTNWTNVPPSANEGGARLGDLSEDQLERACDLLATVLSPQGYAKMRDIMLADDRLLRGGAPRVGFGAENFWLVIFGEPSADEAWALQLDGHHIALNLAFDGEHATMSPSFIGTQPSAYRRADAEIVPLRGEVVDGFALVNSLSEDQREAAILGPKRGRILAGPGRDGVVPTPEGVACSTFDEDQRALLAKLLRHFVGDLPQPIADRRMRALEAEIDEMVFAWSGPTDNPSDVSYRVQGPSVIVEYACQDLGGNPLDHLHSMYRDPTNEYGAAFAGD